MKAHPRLRRAAKWGGLTLAVVCLAAWAASRSWVAGIKIPAGLVAGVAYGRVHVWCGHGDDLPLLISRVWFPSRLLRPASSVMPMEQAAWAGAIGRGVGVAIPLWWIAIAGTLVWLGARALQVRAERAAARAVCPGCRADRRGVRARAACPACGAAAPRVAWVRPRPRARKALRWGGPVVAAVSVVAWVVTVWATAWGRTPWGYSAVLQRGCLSLDWMEGTRPASMVGVDAIWLDHSGSSRPPGPMVWRPAWVVRQGLVLLQVPLWIPAVGGLAVGLAAWGLDRRARAAALPGRCPACRYDLSGLPPAAPCPECGAAGR